MVGRCCAHCCRCFHRHSTHERWIESVGFRCYHGRDDLGHLYYYSAPFCLSQESRCDGFVGGGRARCPRVFKESPECVEFSLGFVRRPVLRRMGSSRLDSVFRRYFSRPMIRPHRHARSSEAVAAQKQWTSKSIFDALESSSRLKSSVVHPEDCTSYHREVEATTSDITKMEGGGFKGGKGFWGRRSVSLRRFGSLYPASRESRLFQRLG